MWERSGVEGGEGKGRKSGLRGIFGEGFEGDVRRDFEGDFESVSGVVNG